MVALRLFGRGIAYLWSRWVQRFGMPGSRRSLVRTLGAVGLALFFALFLVASAGAIAWSFLALATSQQEARAIALLAGATIFSWMSTILIVLSVQRLLPKRLTSLWGYPSHPKPDPLVAATGTVPFVIVLSCVGTRGLSDGAVGAAQAAAFLVVVSLFVLVVRALRATPRVVRSIRDAGFGQLSAHQKLAILSKNQQRTSQKPKP